MLPLVDPWSVCDDLPTDGLVIECGSSEGRSTTGVSEETANDNSVIYIHNRYIMYMGWCIAS